MTTRKGEDKGVNGPKDNKSTGRDPVAAGRAAPEGKSGTYFATPLGSLSSGLLLFVSGASNLTVHADPSMEDLYRARFEGQVPTVGMLEGTVSIEYPRFPPSDQRAIALSVAPRSRSTPLSSGTSKSVVAPQDSPQTSRRSASVRSTWPEAPARSR